MKAEDRKRIIMNAYSSAHFTSVKNLSIQGSQQQHWVCSLTADIKVDFFKKVPKCSYGVLGEDSAVHGTRAGSNSRV